MALVSIYRELLRGKTLARALQNEVLAKFFATLTGRVLDLGGGYGSYYRYLPSGLDITRTNVSGNGMDAFVDIGKPLPYDDSTFDAVLLLNALYVVPNSGAVLQEILRVLKPGGILYLSMPFLMQEIPEPHDYVRYTREGLEHLVRRADFSDVRIYPIGERFTAALTLMHIGPLRLLTFLCAAPALFFDSLVPERIRTMHAAPISYVVWAQK